jgi:hypothetical protein
MAVTVATAQNTKDDKTLAAPRSPLAGDGQQEAESISGELFDPIAELDATRANNQQRLVTALVAELNGFMATPYQSDSAQYKKLEGIVNAFIGGNEAAFTAAIDELKKLEADFPPTKLLLAALNFGTNRIDVGRQALEEVAVEAPEHPGVAMAFARLALSQGRIADSLAQTEKAQRLIEKVKSEAVKKFYGVQSTETLAVIAVAQGRIDDAQRHAIAWEKLDAKNPRMMLTRAEIEFLKNNIEGSLKYLNQLRAAVPAGRPPEILIASWYGRKNDTENTEKWVKLAAKNNPDDPIVLLEYANWALGREQFAIATNAIKKWEEKSGESLQSKLMKGRIAFAQQDYAAAETLFEDIFKSQPSNFDVSNLYTLSLVESNDSEKLSRARQIAQRNYQAASENQIAIAIYGWVLAKSGDVDAGGNYISQAARAANVAPEVRFFLAQVLFDKGKTTEAKLVLEPALEHNGIFLYRAPAKRLMEKLENG